MSVATSTAIAIGLGGASLATGILGAHAAGKAADAQVSGAEYAANLQHQDSKAALDFEKQQYADRQKELAPWLQAGTWGIGELSSMLKGGAFPDWTENFVAPTDVTEKNDPGYKFRLDQGLKALESTAAARGNLLSGGTAKGEQQFAQDFASNEYGNVYNREYNNYANRYNIFKQNQADKWNRYATMSGIGQTAEGQLANVGTNTSRDITSILMDSGMLQGQYATNAGTARASGYVGGANAWGGALGSGTNNLMELLMMSKMFNPGTFPVGGQVG